MGKTPYNTGTETKVQQQHKDDVNINTIVRRFAQGALPSLNVKTPMYLDTSEIPSFHQMHNMVAETNQRFMKLPSALRGRFKNKPENLLEFLKHEGNREEAEQLGLIERRPKAQTAQTAPTAPTIPSTPEVAK